MERLSSRLSGVVLALIIAAAAFLTMGLVLTQPAFADEIVQYGEYVVDGNSYVVTTVATDDADGEAAFAVSKKAAKVTVPAAVTLADGKSYSVTGIGSEAFAGTGTKTVIVKTKLLTKYSVVGSLESSMVKTIKVSVGTAQNKKFVAKYKKIFTKKNAGKKVTVK